MGNAAIASLERSARYAEEDANRHRQHIEYLTGALSAACEDFQKANASAASCRAAIAKLEGRIMNHQTMVRAFNEWMRRYIEEPERFEQEWKSVSEFLVDEARGEEPSYGEECAKLLADIAKELPE